MLAFYQRPRRRPNKAAAGGFTLLEILIVLALVGLMAAFSLPQFSVVQDRLAFTLNRDTFERELGGLSYAAFKEGRPLVLSGEYPRRANESSGGSAMSVPQAIDPSLLRPGDLRPIEPVTSGAARLNLPEDWQVNVKNPIVYQPSGFCGGGSVDLIVGDLRYAYDLKAPTCQVELQR